MAPVTRSRKRVLDSEDEADEFANAMYTQFLKSSQAAASPEKPNLPSPIKNGARVNTRTTLSSAASPTRIQKKQKTEDKPRPSNLVALFSRRPQSQTSQSSVNSLASRPRPPLSSADLEIYDLISDGDDDDDDIEITEASSSSFVGQQAQKRRNIGSNSNPRPPVSPRKPTPSPTKPYREQLPISKFTLPGLKAKSMFVKSEPTPTQTRKETEIDDTRPWSERFGPLNLDELAVHKRKVADVRRWLSDALDGRIRQRILLLKGAAGTGKTTTVRLLAQNMGFSILEWKNPSGGLFGNRQSAAAQFESFIGVGGTFGTLDIDEPNVAADFNVASPDEKSRRIILIEEFPNTYTRSSHILSAFRNALSEFLAVNTPSLSMFANGQVKQPIVPIVMIVSETLLTTTSASADSFTAHRLLGPEILRHPGTATIEFNAIAPSILTKALELVVTKEARKSFRKRTPGPLVLKRLGETGDIRNAVASLEFLCIKGDQDGNWGSRVLFSKPKKALREASLTAAEKETLEQVSQRESSLGIFHAVGKVVYNKRHDNVKVGEDSPENLPPYLAHHARPQPSQVNVDTLIDEIGTDTSTFVSALHENYPLSCTQPRFEEGLPTSADHLNGCLDALSDSDMLCPSWDVFFGGRGSSSSMGSLSAQDSGSYVLRQDEMAFQVAVRGLLHALPYPVTRQQHPGRGAPDAFKMFYPTSIKLWRTREEIEALVDMWSTRLLHNGRAPASTRSMTAGASMFRRPSTSTGASQRPHIPHADGTSSSSSPPPLCLGNVCRRELILERLPAMAAILRGAKAHGTTSTTPAALLAASRLGELEQIVTFHGIGARVQDDEADDIAEDVAGVAAAGTSQWATDKPTEETTAMTAPLARRMAIRHKDPALVVDKEEIMVQQLVLSDDDIED